MCTRSLTIAWRPLLAHPVTRRRSADFGLGDLWQRRGRRRLGRRRRLPRWWGQLRRRRRSPLPQPRETRDGAALGREADFARAVRARPLVAAALGRLDVSPGGPAGRGTVELTTVCETSSINELVR